MAWRIALPGSLLVVGLLVGVGYVKSSTSASGQRLLGDVDCNQQVNSIDASLILQVDAGLFAGLLCGDGADVSQDGATNAVDAALILQFNAGLLGGFGKVLSVPTLAITATPPASTTPHNTATPPLTATPENTATPPPVTVLPESTATPPTTPAEAPTPTHTGPCSLWPQQILSILERLSVPDGLCLVRFSDHSELPTGYNCPTACYNAGLREAWCVADCSAPVGGELAALAHEVCHAHQYFALLEAGVVADWGIGWADPFIDPDRPVPDAWGLAYVEQTDEGRDFVERGTWQVDGNDWTEVGKLQWSGYPNPLEDSANVCAVWYFNPLHPEGEGGPENLKASAPIRYQWAQTWLPE